MENNITKILNDQSLFDLYFNNRNSILILGMINLLAITIFMIGRVKKNNSKMDYKTIYVRPFVHIMIAIVIGSGLNAVGFKITVMVKHAPILLLISSMLIVMIVQVAEGIKYYRNYKKVIERTITIVMHIVESMVFILSIMGRLEIIECLAALVGNITLGLINSFIDSYANKKNKSEPKGDFLEQDCPVEQEDELFGPRKKQLPRICEELKTIGGKEPFAIAIVGEWGSGKTSLLNVLQKKMENVEFVNVECDIEYDIKAVLREISLQIKKIFESNNVYTEKNGVIESYFEKIGKLVGEAGYEGMAKLIDSFQIGDNSSYLENRKRMNQELDEFYRLTEKRIFFVIDDMDRIVDDKERGTIFQVIRKSVELHNCLTIFMIDYEHFKNEHMSSEFFEKYIHRVIKLCDMEFEDIVEYYDSFFLKELDCKVESTYVKEKGKEIKKDIINHGKKIIDSIQKEIQEKSKEITSVSVTDEQKMILTSEIEKLSDIQKRLKKRMKNPRKVKRYMGDIQRTLYIVDAMWFRHESVSENKYSREEWGEIIQDVAFLKTFLFEEYEELIELKDFSAYRENKKNKYIVKFILHNNTFITNQNKEKVMEWIVYKLYALDKNQMLIQQQKLLEEVNDGTVKEEDLEYYVNYYLGFEYNFELVNAIIDYIQKQDSKTEINKIKIICHIIKDLMTDYDIEIEELENLMKKVKNCVSSMEKKKMLSCSEKKEIKSIIKDIQTECVYSGKSQICTLLELYYDEEFTKKFEECRLTSISDLYQIISNIDDSQSSSLELNKTGTQLEALKKYFEKLAEEFEQNNKYLYAREEIIKISKKIERNLRILEIWFGKNEIFAEEILDYYDDISGEINQRALENSENLKKALKEMSNYISNHPKDKKPGDAYINLVRTIEEMYKDESNSVGIKNKDVVIELCDLYEKIKRNPLLVETYGERLEFCKIRLFKLRISVGCHEC